MTNAEWAAVELWCLKNGFIPKGNNNYGKDGSESNRKAIPSNMDGSNVGRTATGTGPLSWYHDGTVCGIADLKGDVWEWSGGLRFVFGEVQVLADNSAADLDNPQNASSAMWKAIDATSGSLIDPKGDGRTANSVKVDIVSGKMQYTTTIANATGNVNCKFAEITCAASIGAAAKAVLQALGLLCTDTSADYATSQCYLNNAEAERLLDRGGRWNNSAYGLVSFSGINPRSNVTWGVGFRSAYYKKI